ncbi:MAG: hypothetical protein U9N49_04045 [Campylobacterota bacterium]|nr:hypothetical protein [Campylobacterota bacterium]
MKWLKQLSTQTKTFSFVTILLLSFLVIITYNFNRFKTQRLLQIQTDSYTSIQLLYQHMLHDYKSFYRYILLEQSYSNDIKEALLARDRERLYNLSSALWKRLKDRDKSSNLIHYHLPNGQSFLRVHQPFKHDDNISAFRVMPPFFIRESI